MKRQKRYEFLFDHISRTLLDFNPGDLIGVLDLMDHLKELDSLSPKPELTHDTFVSLDRLLGRIIKGDYPKGYFAAMTQALDVLVQVFDIGGEGLEQEGSNFLLEALESAKSAIDTIIGPSNGLETPKASETKVQEEQASPSPVAASRDPAQEHAREVQATFLHEAFERLDRSQDLLLSLEANQDPSIVNELFRIFHTIKGEAGFLGFPSLGTITHGLESLLDKVREGSIRPNTDFVDLVLGQLDVVREILTSIEAQGTEDQRFKAVAKEAAHAMEHRQTTSPRTQGETQVPSPKPLASQGQERTNTNDGLVSVKASQVSYIIDMIGELLISLSQLDEEDKQVQLARKITRSLQNATMKLGTTKIGNLLGTIKRTARDAARQTGKDFDISMVGEDIEVDRTLVERLGEPLMHLVRNSVVHGLEDDASTRETLGKPLRGSITITAERKGHQVVISVSDDGKGLKTEAIKAKALAQGLIQEQDIQGLSTSDIHKLIFHPGFSTAAKVDSLAGRGVGMDIVKTMVEGLRGSIVLNSQEGQGTKVDLIFPINMAIIDGMIILIGERQFVVPVANVVESLEITETMVHQVKTGVQLLSLRGQTMPILDLAEYFGLPKQPDQARRLVIIIESNTTRYACLIQGIIAKKEVVIKPLGPLFAGQRGLAGGTILQGGRIGLVLDIDHMIRQGQGR